MGPGTRSAHLRQVVDLASNDHPKIIRCIVAGDLLVRELGDTLSGRDKRAARDGRVLFDVQVDADPRRLAHGVTVILPFDNLRTSSSKRRAGSVSAVR